MDVMSVVAGFLIVMGGVFYLLWSWVKERDSKRVDEGGNPPPRGVAEGVTWPPPPSPPVVNIDLDAVHRAIDLVPNKVLQAVISSTNNLKGNLGELIGYLKLHAAYDRIIPLGNIVDFICIKLPKDGKEGCIDFVDIKTGGSAKLSRDQSQLKKLIEEKKINFVKLKVETNTDPIGEPNE